MKNKYKNNFELEKDELLKKYKELGLPETFCPVPFTTVIAEPDGKIGSCRLKGSDFAIGNIREKTLEEIWNDEFVVNWRKEFLTGEIKTCSREIKHRGCNLCSENNKLLEKIEFSEVQNQKILKFTANFNGFCNLECKMCNVWKKPNGLYDEIGFWEKAETEIFPFIEEIDFLSGEPFIQKDTFKLIDMVSKSNPNCKWLFTTNANYKFSKHIKEKLDKIKLKSIMISIDSFNKKTFSEIRLKGDLNLVLETAEKIKQYEKEREQKGEGFLLVLGFLIQKDNWKELGTALDYCLKMNFRPHIQYVYEPEEESVLNWGYKKQLEILDWYLENLTWQQIEMGIRALTPSIDMLKPIDKASFLIRLKEKRLKDDNK